MHCTWRRDLAWAGARGELDLAKVRACGSGGSAARAQQGRFDVVSVCVRYIRGEIVGTGQLLTRRDRGETVYLARKRPPAAGS